MFVGWMNKLGFTSLSTVFQSFRDDERVNMKGHADASYVCWISDRIVKGMGVHVLNRKNNGQCRFASYFVIYKARQINSYLRQPQVLQNTGPVDNANTA